MTKISVGVLMGGMSLEKEVSFNSGRTVCDHLDTRHYNVTPIFQNSVGELYIIPQKFLYRGKISDFEQRLTTEAQRIFWHDIKQNIDIVFIAQHGRFAEDGCMQGMLEVLQIPYVGSKVLGSALGMDKYMQKFFLALHGVKTPRGIRVRPDEIAHLSDQLLAKNALSYPVIVKPIHEGSSFGVALAYTLDELKAAAHAAAYINNTQPQAVIIEEKIRGMEFTCIVVQDPQTQEYQPLSVTEIESKDDKTIFNYEQKYMPGRSIKWTPARCSEEDREHIYHTAIQTMHALNFCTIGRIDGFLTPEGEVVIIDPNTLSGLAPSSFAFVQAAQKKMSHGNFIQYLLESEMKKNKLPAKKDFMFQQSNQQILRESHKKIIAVIFGGASNEREISLESGRNVIYKLSSEKYQVIPLFLSKALTLHRISQEELVLNSTQEIEARLSGTQLWSLEDIKAQIDFVFIALHGGIGENGSLQGALELMHIPYNGSGVLASALCMDKFKTTQLLSAAHFDTPRNLLWDLTHEISPDTLPADFPLIVKPHNDGCSVGVHKVENRNQLQDTLKALKNQGFTHALIEEYVRGMELTVGVMGNDYPEALPPSAAIAQQAVLSIEEKFLPGAGENQTPAPLPDTALTFVQRTIEAIYKVMGCSGYARIDCFYQSPQISPTGRDRLVVIEINTLPGLTPATVIFHQAAEVGMSPSQFLDKIIELGFEKHRPQVPETSVQKTEQKDIAQA